MRLLSLTHTHIHTHTYTYTHAHTHMQIEQLKMRPSWTTYLESGKVEEKVREHIL